MEEVAWSLNEHCFMQCGQLHMQACLQFKSCGVARMTKCIKQHIWSTMIFSSVICSVVDKNYWVELKWINNVLLVCYLILGFLACIYNIVFFLLYYLPVIRFSFYLYYN